MTPRHFGYSFGLGGEREPVTIADHSGGGWAIAAVVGVVLVLGGVGLYALSSGDGARIATALVDETLGRGTRPTLPTLPH